MPWETVLDDLDRRILHALQADPRASYRKVARMAGTTTPTAIARTKRMLDLGAIQGFQTLVAPWADASSASPPARPADGPHCHQCHGPLPKEPIEKRIAGRSHVFCCMVCRDTMVARATSHGG